MKNTQGQQLPMGVTVQEDGVSFSVAAKKGKACCLLLYHAGEKEPCARYPMRQSEGAVYTVKVTDIQSGAYAYEYLMDEEVVTDPYTKAFTKENKSQVLIPEYDWEDDRYPAYAYKDVIAYSLHVRGFTQDSYSKVAHRGTFEGVIEKLPYLKDLGINQIQCMPVYSFLEGKRKPNYWGYGPGYFFAPKNSYSAISDGVRSLKNMVKACHEAEIEVVLEMPFCPETPIYQVLDCLRYYRQEYHIDGYILNPAAVSTRAAYEDPYLQDCKLMVHHTEFQNVMRRFLKGDEGVVTDVMYQTRKRWDLEGIYNCITTHTGFTLKDLVSYDGKHNEANGENNQDGPDYNYSWNCGAEGLTRKKAVLELRKNQMRNAMFLLLLSQGVPCILAGDEFANSQKGNNNVYCQDNPIGWLNWRNLLKEQEMYQFVKQLIKFRKKYRLFHQEKELLGIDQSGCGMPDVSYHGEMAWRAPTEVASRQIGIYYSSQDKEEADCFVAYNMHWLEHEFALPALKKGRKWYRAASTKEGILKELVVLENQRNIELDEREIVVLVSGKGETV